MAVFNVADATQLASALLAAKAGDTISLAAGDYGTLALNGALTSQAFAKFDGPVTIKSADVDHPATFTSVNLSNVSNLAFEGVKFDLVTSSAGNFTPFKVDDFEQHRLSQRVIRRCAGRGPRRKAGTARHGLEEHHR